MLICGWSIPLERSQFVICSDATCHLAPTGAVSLPFLVLVGHSLNVVQGKTDVAMLTVLRVISQHLNRSAPPGNMAAAVERDKFKIIYV